MRVTAFIKDRLPNEQELSDGDLFLCRQVDTNSDFEYMVLWFDPREGIFKSWHDEDKMYARDPNARHVNVEEWCALSYLKEDHGPEQQALLDLARAMQYQNPESTDFKMPGFLPGERPLYIVQRKLKEDKWEDLTNPKSYEDAKVFARALKVSWRIVADLAGSGTGAAELQSLSPSPAIWDVQTQSLRAPFQAARGWQWVKVHPDHARIFRTPLDVMYSKQDLWSYCGLGPFYRFLEGEKDLIQVTTELDYLPEDIQEIILQKYKSAIKGSKISDS